MNVTTEHVSMVSVFTVLAEDLQMRGPSWVRGPLSFPVSQSPSWAIHHPRTEAARARALGGEHSRRMVETENLGTGQLPTCPSYLTLHWCGLTLSTVCSSGHHNIKKI